MKHMLKGLLAATMLLSMSSAFACCPATGSSCCTTDCSTDCCTTDCSKDCCTAAFPLFLPRSQSENAARDMVGMETLINRFEMEKLNGVFYITPEYAQSFKPCRMAASLFGEALVNGQLTISGSRLGHATYVKRGDKDLLADNFGLPTDFKSTVKFAPKIQHFVLDMGLYLGLDELWEGGFFKIHAPVNWTKWNLNACETVATAGTLGYDMGYMNSAATGVTNDVLKKTWKDAMSDSSYTWGDMKEGMKYGLLSTCARSITRLADIQVALGWNFLQDADYHFGLMIRGAFPTGNRPCSTYLFEPIAGNGRHWELGGGLTSHATLWRSEDEESMFNVYIDANLTHLFKDKQFRSFDFADKPLSRYMLIEELGTPITNLYATTAATVAGSQPVAQYKGNLFHAINKTTCCTDVSIDMQGDLAIKFAYITGNWDMDLGYNLWGRTGEKFGGACCSDTCVPAKTYALKGDAFIYGFVNTTGGGALAAGTAVPLSATESKATIYAGTNTPSTDKFITPDQLRNPSIDNPLLASVTAAAENQNMLHYRAGDAYNANLVQRTSLQPQFVGSLNTCKGPSALSNKIFANLAYAWKDREESDWVPFLGIGGEVEFGAKTSGNYSAVSQWGVWVKGGLAFN